MRYDDIFKNRAVQANKNAKYRGAIFRSTKTKKAELMLGFLY